MAKNIVALAMAVLSVAACNQAAEQPETAPVSAMFDTDFPATQSWRAQLIKDIGANATTEAAEAALSAQGMECGTDPSTPHERACTSEGPHNAADNATEMGDCKQLRIVRTQPWQVQSAQVIIACGAIAAAANSVPPAQ